MSSQPGCTGLNYSYGVNAWKCWVQSKYANGETSKADELRFGREHPGDGGGDRDRRQRVSRKDAEELWSKGWCCVGFKA